MTITREAKARDRVETSSAPYRAGVRALKWLALALKKDTSREPLLYARALAWRGDTYLATTDTHRIHAVRIAAGTTEPLPDGEKLLDLRRLLHELAYCRAKGEVCWDLDRVIDVGGHPVEVHAPLWVSGKGSWPRAERVADASAFCPVASLFAVNYRYLLDALAGADACQSLAGRAVLMQGDPTRQITIAPRFPDTERRPNWEWFAVVMPMDGRRSER